MSSIEMAVRNARAIETLLVERLGANGKGLHEKLSSVEKQLPPHIVKTARWIATLRNSAVHQHDFEIGNPEDFMNAAARVLAHLEAMPKATGAVTAAQAAQAAQSSMSGSMSGGPRLETIRPSRPQPGAYQGGSVPAAVPARTARRRRPPGARSSGQGWWLAFVLVAGGLLVAALFKSGALRSIVSG